MLFYDFWLKSLRDSKIWVAKDYGKELRSKLAVSFSGIVHFTEHTFQWKTSKSYTT